MGMGDIHTHYWIYLQSSYSYLEIGVCLYPSQSGLLISYLNIWPGGDLLDPDSHVLVIPVRIDRSYTDRYLAWSVSTKYCRRRRLRPRLPSTRPSLVVHSDHKRKYVGGNQPFGSTPGVAWPNVASSAQISSRVLHIIADLIFWLYVNLNTRYNDVKYNELCLTCRSNEQNMGNKSRKYQPHIHILIHVHFGLKYRGSCQSGIDPMHRFGNKLAIAAICSTTSGLSLGPDLEQNMKDGALMVVEGWKRVIDEIVTPRQSHEYQVRRDVRSDRPVQIRS